jgi:hypothetical protein
MRSAFPVLSYHDELGVMVAGNFRNRVRRVPLSYFECRVRESE